MQRTMHAAVGSTVAKHDSAALLVGHPADSVDPRKHALPHSLWCNATLLQRSNATTDPFAALGGRAATARRVRCVRCIVALLQHCWTQRDLQRVHPFAAALRHRTRLVERPLPQSSDTADSAQDSADAGAKGLAKAGVRTRSQATIAIDI